MKRRCMGATCSVPPGLSPDTEQQTALCVRHCQRPADIARYKSRQQVPDFTAVIPRSPDCINACRSTTALLIAHLPDKLVPSHSKPVRHRNESRCIHEADRVSNLPLHECELLSQIWEAAHDIGGLTSKWMKTTKCSQSSCRAHCSGSQQPQLSHIWTQVLTLRAQATPHQRKTAAICLVAGAECVAPPLALTC